MLPNEYLSTPCRWVRGISKTSMRARVLGGGLRNLAHACSLMGNKTWVMTVRHPRSGATPNARIRDAWLTSKLKASRTLAGRARLWTSARMGRWASKTKEWCTLSSTQTSMTSSRTQILPMIRCKPLLMGSTTSFLITFRLLAELLGGKHIRLNPWKEIIWRRILHPTLWKLWQKRAWTYLRPWEGGKVSR